MLDGGVVRVETDSDRRTCLSPRVSIAMDRPSPSSPDPRSDSHAACELDAGKYWDDVGSEWATKRPDRLWREYSDRLQIALLDRWLEDCGEHSGDAPPAALKTDLFDEVAGRGIVRHLSDRGFRTTGIDISPVVVSEAVSRNPDLHAHRADVRHLPFADAAFDVVYSGSTLDHFATVADIDRGVRELVRVLRPSGRLLLTLDNPLNPLVWLRNGPLLGILRYSGIVPYHVGATLGPRRLADLVQSSGMDVLQTTAILHCPRVLAVRRARTFEERETSRRERFLESLLRWEHLEQWPSRFLSGHFVAILAIKRS
jgi:SAM-dependent methyltransferase